MVLRISTHPEYCICNIIELVAIVGCRISSAIYVDEFKKVNAPVVGNYIHGVSCICNVCLRQPPTLKGSASHAVYHLTFNVVQFALTS